MKIKDYFEDYLSYLAQKGLKTKTIKEHERFLYGSINHSGIQDKKLSQLKLTDIAKIIEAGRAHGEFGPQRSVCVFRSFLRYLKESSKKLPFDWRDIPVPKVLPKEPVVLERDELQEILESFPINHKNTGARKMALTMRVLCEVLFSTGMRISEALSLKREQFEEIKKKRELIINGKTGQRKVFFSQRAIEWLERYLKERNDNCEVMFVNCYGEPLKFTTAKSYILRLRKKLGLVGKKLKFHTFRRTLATQLLEQGCDVKSLQVIMGHKSERTTLRYYVKANERRAKEIHFRIVENLLVK